MNNSNNIQDIKARIESYLRNYPILLSILDSNVIKKFLKHYNSFIVGNIDIYINSLLLNSKLIDLSLFKKLESENFSILELARITEFEISKNLEINLRLAFLIKIIAQFHYSNLFFDLLIYYAHSIDNYNEIIESKELKIIKLFFPFAKIINPSKLNPEWQKNSYSRSEIMENCLEIVSEVDLVIFSPLNGHFISKGVFEEINLSNHLNIPNYLLVGNKLHKYTLMNTNGSDWKNYCEYKVNPLVNDGMSQNTFNVKIEELIKKNTNFIKNSVFYKRKKIIIISNSTFQSEIIIKILYQQFNDSKINILPILGKYKLCKEDYINNNCENHNIDLKPENYDFFTVFRENIFKKTGTTLIDLIKFSTPKNLCPYSLLYENVKKTHIIVINKIFFKSIRIRTKLRREILLDNPYNFILIFDNIYDLFSDYIESKCFDIDLKNALEVLKEKNNDDYRRASLIIKKLLELSEEERLDVNYELTKFLEIRYKNRTKNTNLLEKIYDICKTPFGYWTRRHGEIIQVIASNSLKNFLNYFFHVIFLKSRNLDQISEGK